MCSLVQRIVLLSSILTASHTCLSQDVVHYNYSFQDGLPSSQVYDIYQDKQGFIWFATDNGISKFDGREFTNYNVKDGLSDPMVLGFEEDYKGRIWMRTFSGKISYYENGKIHIYKFNDKLENLCNSFMFSLHCDQNDKILFTCGDRLCSIDSAGNYEMTEIGHEEYEYKRIDNKYDLLRFYGPTYKIPSIKIGDKTYKIELPNSSTSNPVVRCEHWHNNLYLTLNNNVFEYNGDTVKNVYTGKTRIISFSKDNNDNIWLGTMNGGVLCFKNNFNEASSSLHFLNSKTVTKTLTDHEGGYWFSTLESGVYYVPNINIKTYPLPSETKIVEAVVNHNCVITGDLFGNINSIDMKTKTLTWTQKTKYPIVDLYVDSLKNLWVSAAHGLLVYDHNHTLKKTYKELCLVSYSQDENGFIWAVGSNRIAKFTNTCDSVFYTKVHVYHRSILAKDSILFLATRNSMEIRDTKLQLLNKPKSLQNMTIAKIISINDTTLLLSTIGHGFLLLNPRSLRYETFNSQRKFIADNVYDIVEHNGSLWLGTEKGIVVVSIGSLLSDIPDYHYFTKRSGILNDKVNFLVAGNDQVWVFTDEGFTVIPDYNKHFTNNSPIFYLKSTLINTKKTNLDQPTSLQHNQNNIEIDYGFISFNNQNINTRYRLRDSDQWHYTNNRKIIFNSLAPAGYDFELEFSIDNIHWEKAKSFQFVIKKPWWDQWYFQLAVGSFVALIAFIYFRNRIAQYKQRNYYLKVINDNQQKLIQAEIETLERERGRIAKELHDGVGTNLTAIKLQINQVLKQYSESTATKVEDQFQEAIKEIKDIIYGLTPSGLERYGLFASLKDYTEKLNHNVPITIDLNVYGLDIKKLDLSLLIFRVIQELVSNSIKHSSAKKISIHINSFEDLVNIVYEDDGIGFSYDSIKNGLGLNNIESRIQSVHGSLTFESGSFGVSYSIDIPIKSQ